MEDGIRKTGVRLVMVRSTPMDRGSKTTIFLCFLKNKNIIFTLATLEFNQRIWLCLLEIDH